MSAKTPKKVDLERLADALTGYHSAYLVTVDDDYRVHTVDVEPELNEQLIEVGLVGGRTRRNVENRSAVTIPQLSASPGVSGTGGHQHHVIVALPAGVGQPAQQCARQFRRRPERACHGHERMLRLGDLARNVNANMDSTRQ
jgi:hypothetical protein